MALKAVIFDMDGVIVDSEPEYQRVGMELVKSMALRHAGPIERIYRNRLGDDVGPYQGKVQSSPNGGRAVLGGR